MPVRDDRIYRVHDGLIAGVCGGIARHYGIDAGLIRLFAVILCILTAGTLAVAYLALWLVLPKEADTGAPVDVRPDSIASDVYDRVVSDHPVSNSASSPAGIGHVPPPAPSASCDPQFFWRNPSSAQSSCSPQSPPSAPPQPAGYRPAGARAVSADGTSRSRSIGIGLVLGLVLVAAGMASLLSNVTGVFSPIQFWPLIVVAVGIARMVIPGRVGSRMTAFAIGLMLFSVGIIALLSTLGVVVVRFDEWMRQGFPVLLIVAGLFILGRSFHSPVLIFCSAVAFAAFCLIGIFFYMDAGAARNIFIDLPSQQDVMVEPGDFK